jgi:hypothetical protein
MMLPVLSALLAFAVGLFRSRASLCVEHPTRRCPWAVDQQTAHRPRLRLPDGLFWVWLCRLWSGWQVTLVFVQPRTAMAWQQRCRDHWRRLSQRGTSRWSEQRHQTCHRTSLGLVISRSDAIGNGSVCLMFIDMPEGHLLPHACSNIGAEKAVKRLIPLFAPTGL